MSSSLRFVGLLLGLGILAALGSGVIQHRQTTAAARSGAQAMTAGKVELGEAVIARYGCGNCHVIPGIPAAKGRVGPSLRAFTRRAMIAGKLPNDPGNLIRWIREPQHIVPGNAMPEQQLSEADARNIAAYLLTMRK